MESNLVVAIVNKCIDLSATAYKNNAEFGADSTQYITSKEQSHVLWELFRDEILEKANQEELTTIFDYVDNIYKDSLEQENENSKYVCEAANDYRYNITSQLNRDKGSVNLNQEVNTMSSRSR